jgi:Na+/proline symporter
MLNGLSDIPLVTLLTIGVVASYFGVLFLIARATAAQEAGNSSFFIGNRQSPWYVVAFGMIGTTFSGVTFISVPGWVGATQFSYFQMVLGYIAGYTVIALVLMPLYYRLNLTSIYGFLDQRFGPSSYRTGSFFFMVSRSIGAAFRLYLVAIVFQVFVFEPFNIPFVLAVVITLALIWIYTHRGGIKTIIWTDALQTALMLTALIVSLFYLGQTMDLSASGLVNTVSQSQYGQVFFFEDYKAANFFPKQFLSGAFIAIVMTGLDQDMMQKNLSCPNLIVKLTFLILGALLFLYANREGIAIPDKSDYLYPQLAFEEFPLAVSLIFILGLTASAYSSADSALAALTTAFCVDFLGFERRTISHQLRTRYAVHLGFTAVLLGIILFFHYLNDQSVISKIFDAASYTYGPLLGLFSFGLFTYLQPRDRFIPAVCLVSPVLSYFIGQYAPLILGGYEIGTFTGLWMLSYRRKQARPEPDIPVEERTQPADDKAVEL